MKKKPTIGGRRTPLFLDVLWASLLVSMFCILAVVLWEISLENLLFAADTVDNGEHTPLNLVFGLSEILGYLMTVFLIASYVRFRTLRNNVRLEASLENAHDLIIITNGNYEVAYINRGINKHPALPESTRSLLSSTEERNFWNIMFSLSDAETITAARAELESTGRWQGDIQLFPHLSQSFWVNASIHLVHKRSGKLDALYASFRDINIIRSLHEETQSLDAEIQMLLDDISGFVYRWVGRVTPHGLETTSIEFSKQYFQITGADEHKKSRGLEDLTSLVHPDDVERYQQEAYTAFASRNTFNTKLRLKVPDGYEWVQIDGRKVNDATSNEEAVWIGVCRIVTKEVEALSDLERFRQVVENTSQALVVVDPQAETYYQNRMADQLFGAEISSYDELKSKFTESSREAFDSDIVPIARRGGTWVGEVECNPNGSDPVPLKMRLTSVKRDKEQGLIAFASFVDITNEKDQQKELQEAIRAARDINRTRSWLLNELAHDLNEPVGTAGLLIGTLSEEVIDERQKTLVEVAHSSISSLKELLSSLVTYSRFEEVDEFPIRTTSFDVRGLLSEIEESFDARAKLHDVFLSAAGYTVLVNTDYKLLSKLISSILRDALKNQTCSRILLGTRTAEENSVVDIWIRLRSGDCERYELFSQRINDPQRPPDCQPISLDLEIADTVARLMGIRSQINCSESEGARSETVVRWRLHLTSQVTLPKAAGG